MREGGKTTTELLREAHGMPVRRSSLEAWRPSEGLHAEAQRIARIGNYVLNVATGKWSASSTFHALMGLGDEFPHTFSAWLTIVHLEDQPLLERTAAALLSGEMQAVDIEFRVVRPEDGVLRWFRGLGHSQRDRKGAPALVQGTAQDITLEKQHESELRENRELMRLFIEHAPAALAMFDREMRYLAASRRWREVNFESEACEYLGRSHYDLFPNPTEHVREAHRRGLAGETVRNERDLILSVNGVQHWSRWEVRPWRTGAGEIGGILIFSENITESVQAQDKMLLAALVFSNIHEGILITDAEQRVIEVNEAFTRITGYTREEVLGELPYFLNSSQQTDGFYRQMHRELLENKRWSGDLCSRRKDGSHYIEALTISVLTDEQGEPRHFIGMLSDITQQKENELQLQRVAHYDALTGLPNRTLLADRLHQAMVQAERSGRLLALVYLDLDGFKTVNDTFGHAAGDKLLADLSVRMKNVLREGDTLARLGGDEFVCILLDLDGTEDCTRIVRRLLVSASEPTEIAGLTASVSASLGVVFFPQAESLSADRLLRQADQAMYRAKLSGKNCFHFFDHSLDQGMLGHYEDISIIRKAIQNREFELYYQPWVNMRTGVVRGVEALIRWRHPTRGLLPPSMFLPMIEEHPAAIELGEWVIDEAFGQVEAWAALGLRVHMSINVGAMQLQCEDFPERLASAFARHPGVRPAQVELEILETSALKDIVQILQVIEACRELGVSFALDDFGVGYSSLTCLKQLPTRTLKIDQSFVRGILHEAEDLTIIEGVQGLANAFHRQVIAEGVESAAHGRVLLHLGCELAQGYEIARPMRAEDFPGWYASWRPDPSWSSAETLHEDDRPLLYAMIEHRAWMKSAEAFLKGERLSAPMVSLNRCRFHQWLLRRGCKFESAEGGLRRVESIDCNLHRLAEEVIDLYESDNSQEAFARLKELRSLGEAFFDSLRYLRLGKPEVKDEFEEG